MKKYLLILGAALVVLLLVVTLSKQGKNFISEIKSDTTSTAFASSSSGGVQTVSSGGYRYGNSLSNTIFSENGGYGRGIAGALAYTFQNCKHVQPVNTAVAMLDILGATSAQRALILNPAKLYTGGNNPSVGLYFLCLDSGYTSTIPSASAIQIIQILASSSQMILVPTQRGGSNSTSSTASSTTNAATSSTTYSVRVDYSHFTAEAAQYGYTSVYTSSGTKTVSITVFKFNDSPTMTAAQVVAKLATLGYRPATIDELYALKSQGTSLGGLVVGLGTNLGGTYGYSTSQGSGTAGMGHSAGPFNTSTIKFAAVHN